MLAQLRKIKIVLCFSLIVGVVIIRTAVEQSISKTARRIHHNVTDPPRRWRRQDLRFVDDDFVPPLERVITSNKSVSYVTLSPSQLD